jgi:lysophospholipase L1-like esterase
MVAAAAVVAVGATALGSRRGRAFVIARSRQFAALATAMALSLVLLDVGLTATGIVPTMAVSRATTVEYGARVYARHQPIPQVKEMLGERFEVNSHRTLGPEFDVVKPPGTIRVLFLGGSQVFTRFPALVGERLRAAGLPVEVINGATPGHQSADSLGKLVTDYWRFRPDHVVVIHAWNDIKYFSLVGERRSLMDVVEPFRAEFLTSPPWFDDLLCCSACWRAVRGSLLPRLTGLRPLLEGGAADRADVPGSIQPLAVEQYRLDIRTLCDVSRSIGAQPILCIQPRLPVADPAVRAAHAAVIRYDYAGMGHDELLRAFAACDEVLRSVAAEKGAPLIEGTAALTGNDEYFGDHIHLTRAGNDAMAEVLTRELRQLLAVAPAGITAPHSPR